MEHFHERHGSAAVFVAALCHSRDGSQAADQGIALKSLTFLALKPHHGAAYFGLLGSWTGPKSIKFLKFGLRENL